MASMKKKLAAISESKTSTKFVVVAKVEAIDLEKPWYYTACNFCNRKMDREVDGFETNEENLQQNPLYHCERCNKDFQDGIKRYYLVLRVTDESKFEGKFLLFHNVAEKLLRRPAFELVVEAAQVNPLFIPQSLSDLVGRKVLFMLSTGSYGQEEPNSAYVVDSVFDNAEIINLVEPHPHQVIFHDYESDDD